MPGVRYQYRDLEMVPGYGFHSEKEMHQMTILDQRFNTAREPLTVANLLAFLKSDTRYTVRTVGAIAYHFGRPVAEVDQTIGQSPASFSVRLGKGGIFIGANV